MIDWIAFDGDGGTLRAHAKLNVTLEVLGRRADGFHEVVHLMSALELHDTIVLRRSKAGIRLRSSDPALDTDDNLALRAARLLAQRFGVRDGLEIELAKAIPIAGGLGGGSSDAAAVLLGASRVWGLPPTDLTDLAAELGSDVPFFLSGGLAVCEGRGERVRPITGRLDLGWVVLFAPPIGVSTADAYRRLPAEHRSDGRHSREIIARLERGDVVDLRAYKNTMEASVLADHPEIARARDAMRSAGAPFVGLCGTGSTLFTSLPRLDLALALLARLPGAILTRSHDPR